MYAALVGQPRRSFGTTKGPGQGRSTGYCERLLVALAPLIEAVRNDEASTAGLPCVLEGGRVGDRLCPCIERGVFGLLRRPRRDEAPMHYHRPARAALAIQHGREHRI